MAMFVLSILFVVAALALCSISAFDGSGGDIFLAAASFVIAFLLFYFSVYREDTSKIQQNDLRLNGKLADQDDTLI